VTKQHLVVVRAGDNSLHPHWLAGDGDRTWDLVVSYFGDDPDIFKVDDGVRIDSKGPKWPALYELFSLYPNLATDYNYIWLPDDDLMASKADINRLFDICVAYGLEVGPSGPDMEQLLRPPHHPAQRRHPPALYQLCGAHGPLSVGSFAR
jgi:hypothetical protein